MEVFRLLSTSQYTRIQKLRPLVYSYCIILARCLIGLSLRLSVRPAACCIFNIVRHSFLQYYCSVRWKLNKKSPTLLPFYTCTFFLRLCSILLSSLPLVHPIRILAPPFLLPLPCVKTFQLCIAGTVPVHESDSVKYQYILCITRFVSYHYFVTLRKYYICYCFKVQVLKPFSYIWGWDSML
jgi:hypothetical protein